MKILTLSDKVIDEIYSPLVKEKFADVDLVIGCGDLPYTYLEYVMDMLDVPVFFVRGNHGLKVEYIEGGERTEPWGAVDLHKKFVRFKDLLMVGFEGSVRYRRGPFQYSQLDMWFEILGMIPRLIFNRFFYGRELDVLVSHAPPWKINDKPDLAHHGFKSLRWLISVFKPRYHFHGHIHIHQSVSNVATSFEQTQVVNTYGYRTTEIPSFVRGTRTDSP